jgi:protein tyrosine/serine phosphatase
VIVCWVLFGTVAHAAPQFANELVHNIHTVEKDTFYRSRQLAPEVLAAYIEKFGIKSVINLRGCREKAVWWHAERSVCEQHSVEHYDVRLSARNWSDRKAIEQLLNLYETAKKPILAHCHMGADRAGEASALWIWYRGWPLKDALQQLTSRYRHASTARPCKRAFIKDFYRHKMAFFEQMGEVFEPQLS